MRKGERQPRFRVTEDEMRVFRDEIRLIGPGMSADQGIRARDAMGHLIRGLRGAESRILELKAENALLRRQISEKSAESAGFERESRGKAFEIGKLRERIEQLESQIEDLELQLRVAIESQE